MIFAALEIAKLEGLRPVIVTTAEYLKHSVDRHRLWVTRNWITSRGTEVSALRYK